MSDDDTKSTLVCFGFGYSAEHFVGMFGEKFDRIVGTVRGAERAAVLDARTSGRLRALIFDGKVVTPELHGAMRDADAVLVSVPPDENGDPVLRVFGGELGHAANLRSVVYLSTIGVYGDCGGAWVDEATPAKPGSARSRERLAAEQAWQELGARRGIAVADSAACRHLWAGPERTGCRSRAAGPAASSSPGRSSTAFTSMTSRKPSMPRSRARHPAFSTSPTTNRRRPGDPIAFAAQLMGVAPPPEIPFEAAAQTMSPMALSFWQECRRVRNNKLKNELGVSLLYPTYREGLRALLAQK